MGTPASSRAYQQTTGWVAAGLAAPLRRAMTALALSGVMGALPAAAQTPPVQTSPVQTSPVQTSPAQTSSVQTCQLGDLRLEGGAVIPNTRMTYITHGTPNADRSNAILSIHGLRGNRDAQSFLAGPGRALDTDRYFVIQPDTLGVASTDPVSTTSPTRSGMNMGFPRFTLRDMVNAEHRLLTECLNIRHLVAVTGISMGGNGSLQWAVSFPDFMDAVIPVVPMAYASRQDAFIWELARQAIMLDPKWKDGAYPADDPPRRGVGVGINIQNAFGFSAESFDAMFKDRAAVDRFVATTSEQLGASTDARDWVYRTWAIVDHDIAAAPPFNGDLRAAARSIRARLLLIPNCFDQLHSPGAGGVMELAANAPNAKIADIDDIHGHSGNSSPRGVTVVTAEVRDLLQRIADGRPGFSGPRFPRHWARADRCPARYALVWRSDTTTGMHQAIWPGAYSREMAISLQSIISHRC